VFDALSLFAPIARAYGIPDWIDRAKMSQPTSTNSSSRSSVRCRCSVFVGTAPRKKSATAAIDGALSDFAVIS